MPNLNSPLPQDWITEEGHYYIVYASNLSMLDPLTLFCPDSRIDDGMMIRQRHLSHHRVFKANSEMSFQFNLEES